MLFALALAVKQYLGVVEIFTRYLTIGHKTADSVALSLHTERHQAPRKQRDRLIYGPWVVLLQGRFLEAYHCSQMII